MSLRGVNKCRLDSVFDLERSAIRGRPRTTIHSPILWRRRLPRSQHAAHPPLIPYLQTLPPTMSPAPPGGFWHTILVLARAQASGIVRRYTPTSMWTRPFPALDRRESPSARRSLQSNAIRCNHACKEVREDEVRWAAMGCDGMRWYAMVG